MAGVDASALKGRGRLGAPPKDGNPQIDGARSQRIPAENSSATASAQPVTPLVVSEAAPQQGAEPDAALASCPLAGAQAVTLAAAINKSAPARIDGRALRRTGRTRQLGLKVTAAFDDELRAIAAARGLLLAEVLEEMMAAYVALPGQR